MPLPAVGQNSRAGAGARAGASTASQGREPRTPAAAGTSAMAPSDLTATLASRIKTGKKGWVLGLGGSASRSPGTGVREMAVGDGRRLGREVNGEEGSFRLRF
jgi:hypothetical protein